MGEVDQFEKLIADYYNAPYAVSTDCCTHAIELCLRLLNPKKVVCPTNTYLSIPMTFEKLGLSWEFVDNDWKDYYYIGHTNIIDAAVYWKKDGYIPGTFMCLSFQYKKHLSTSRGGMILLDDEDSYRVFSKTKYDGRLQNIPWAEQDVDTLGYHYYMTPETAQKGIEEFHKVKDISPRHWSYLDYPNLSTMKVFNVK